MFDRAYHLAEKLIARLDRLIELLELDIKERQRAKR
jgi:hypothetical protein